MARCHSKFAVYGVINCRTNVRVHIGTYIENVNIGFYGLKLTLRNPNVVTDGVMMIRASNKVLCNMWSYIYMT